jgi:hypothetical protein
VADTTIAGGSAYISLAFDANGRAMMSYYDVRNADLKVARLNGSTWSARPVASKGLVGMYSNLLINKSTGAAEVLYFSKGHNAVFRATSTGTTWSLQQVVSGGGRWLSTAVAPDGSVTMSWLGSAGLGLVEL